MMRVLSLAGVKFILMAGMCCGGLAAWALDHFESKEHIVTMKEFRDRELNQLDNHIERIDQKVDILLERTR